MSLLDWVRGDLLGIELPAHAEALRDGGEKFLTEAFRATGALGAENRVTRITRLEGLLAGGTGSKAYLSVEYADPGTPHTDLFVKFSRDFTNAWRDRGKNMMDSEVRFALLSRTPGFPVAVPTCLFADYHRESGTGVLITQRIAFGTGLIERGYEKAKDFEVPNALEHYRALIAANARLAGTHRAGRLPRNIHEEFAFDANRLLLSDRIPYSAADLNRKCAMLTEFATKHPLLLPAKILDSGFLPRFADEAQRYLAHELHIKRFLYGATDFIALCHWNANIDNAWFWRDPGGHLECGLLDWGRVTQLNVAQALFGSLCAAEHQLWDEHLDEILALFVREFHRGGGPELNVAELKLQLQLFTALMGLAWIVNAPSVIQGQVPALAEVQSRFDSRLQGNELARTQLQLLTVFLNAWQRQELGAVLKRFLR